LKSRLIGCQILASLVLILLAGCAGLGQPGLATTPTPAPRQTPTPNATPAVSPTPGPVTLRLWLPPQFDPAAETPAGQLLRARLETFTTRRPDVRLEVRIKAPDGPGGLLDALTNTTAAAPLALPDLVALPRPILEAAALKGLLHPADEFTAALDGPDWYDYARELARLQNSTFGLPFAGDALLMVYRTTVLSQPPGDLASALQLPGPLAFPAADPQALFTLALYQAAGGIIQDEQGRPALDPIILETVLNFYRQAEESELLPYWLTQYASDDQAWEAFENSQADMAITWASRYLTDLPADTSGTPIPTPGGAPFTLASGWVWALASQTPDHQRLSIELAEFLTESSFMAEWTSALGLLPTRLSALDTWQSPSLRAMAQQIVPEAHPYPSADLLTSLAPVLQKATIDVLKQQSQPLTAAQEAAGSLVAP
jgi:ABC-type glycerol-3-phosphate transport system substrate-binding protein